MGTRESGEGTRYTVDSSQGGSSRVTRKYGGAGGRERETERERTHGRRRGSRDGEGNDIPRAGRFFARVVEFRTGSSGGREISGRRLIGCPVVTNHDGGARRRCGGRH